VCERERERERERAPESSMNEASRLLMARIGSRRLRERDKASGNTSTATPLWTTSDPMSLLRESSLVLCFPWPSCGVWLLRRGPAGEASEARPAEVTARSTGHWKKSSTLLPSLSRLRLWLLCLCCFCSCGANAPAPLSVWQERQRTAQPGSPLVLSCPCPIAQRATHGTFQAHFPAAELVTRAHRRSFDHLLGSRARPTASLASSSQHGR
jgi:hypothetical protein